MKQKTLLWMEVKELQGNLAIFEYAIKNDPKFPLKSDFTELSNIISQVHKCGRIMSAISLEKFQKNEMEATQNRVLTFEQACEYLGYAKSYVYKLTSAGIIPHSKPNGKSVFFDREKLEQWMLSNPHSSLEERKIAAATYISTHPLKK